MTVLTSRILEETGMVRFAFSTRQGGVSPPPLEMNLSFNVGDDPARVQENRLRLLHHLGTTPNRLALPGQVHSATVRRADQPGLYERCDALVTGSAGLALGVTVADCVPVFLADQRLRVIAAVHAGWRGTAAEISRAAVETLAREYGSRPADLVAYIGPAAGACCYVVGGDVARHFAPEEIHEKEGRPYLDLKGANVRQLLEAGVPPSQVECSPHCTISEETLFHSYRRDGGQSGRMMGVILLVFPPIR